MPIMPAIPAIQNDKVLWMLYFTELNYNLLTLLNPYKYTFYKLDKNLLVRVPVSFEYNQKVYSKEEQGVYYNVFDINFLEYSKRV